MDGCFFVQEAERLGIRRTVHAGENGPAENVRVVSANKRRVLATCRI